MPDTSWVWNHVFKVPWLAMELRIHFSMLSGLIHKWRHWSRSARNIFKVVIQSGASSLKLSDRPSYEWFCIVFSSGDCHHLTRVWIQSALPCTRCLSLVARCTLKWRNTKSQHWQKGVDSFCVYLGAFCNLICQCLHGKVCHRIGSMYPLTEKSNIWDIIDFWRVTSVSLSVV